MQHISRKGNINIQTPPSPVATMSRICHYESSPIALSPLPYKPPIPSTHHQTLIRTNPNQLYIPSLAVYTKAMPLITKLKDLLGLDRAREIYNEWAALLPAKSHLDSEYNFPTARFAGAGILGGKEKDKKDADKDKNTDTDTDDKD